MPTNSALASIINDFHRACTFPPPTSLGTESENHTCPICQEDTLQTDGTEVPIKLIACGHVFGMTCLLTSTLDKVDAGAEAQCPFCRTVYLARRRDGEGWVTPPSSGFMPFGGSQSQRRMSERIEEALLANPFFTGGVYRASRHERGSQRPEGISLFGNGSEEQRPEGSLFAHASEDRRPLFGSPSEIFPITPSPGRSFSGHYPPAEWFQSPTLGTPEEELPATSSPESSLFPPFTPLQVEELLATSSSESPLFGNSPEDRPSLFAPPTARQVLRADEERQTEWRQAEWLRIDEWLRNRMSGSPEEELFAHNPRQESNQPNFRSFPFHDAESLLAGSVSHAGEPILGVRRGPYLLRVRRGRVARLGAVTNARRTRFGRGGDSDDEMTG